jgi:hypothetical protein
MAASGAWAYLTQPPSYVPEGVLAEDTVTVVVGEASGILPITGPQVGLLIGTGLLLVAVGWALARRSKKASDELRLSPTRS